MANYRVYEAAEELGVDSKQLILMLHQMDVRVRSHMSTVTDVQIARLRARLERERRGTPDEGEAESTGTRRRRRRRQTQPKNLRWIPSSRTSWTKSTRGPNWIR